MVSVLDRAARAAAAAGLGAMWAELADETVAQAGLGERPWSDLDLGMP